MRPALLVLTKLILMTKMTTFEMWHYSLNPGLNFTERI